MNEKALSTKKNGMLVLIITILLYAAAIAGCILGGVIVNDGGLPVLLIISILWLCIGWLPL